MQSGKAATRARFRDAALQCRPTAPEARRFAPPFLLA
jgi:hypothetical protein